MGARPTLIQSVQRALRLLEIVAEREERARAKEIARSAGLPLATTYHLLRTCAHEGWLQRLDDGSYVLGQPPPAAREDYLSRHPLHDLTPRTVVDRRRLRLPGPGEVAVDDGEYAVGIRCQAAAVPTPGG